MNGSIEDDPSDSVANRQPRCDTLEIQSFVDNTIQNWRHSCGIQGVNAAQVLKDHPEIVSHRSFVIGLALEEYCLRSEAGEDLDNEGFCRRFSSFTPSVSHSIARQIDVYKYIEDNGELRACSKAIDWPTTGDTVEEFVVIEELGRGAFARVYLCLQQGLGDRQVVLKVAYHGAYEAEILGRLSHPNIVPVYSVSRNPETGIGCVCMPFRGRSTLQDVIGLVFSEKSTRRRGAALLDAARTWKRPADPDDGSSQIASRFSRYSYVEAVIAVGTRLADALSHAHSLGVVHGDLKPSNVLLSFSGDPMLLDFNLSQDDRLPSELLGGTLPYMAPEQIQAMVLDRSALNSRLLPTADIFSLGTVLYELLCGAQPFSQASNRQDVEADAQEIVEKQKTGAMPVNELNPQVNGTLATVIQECLAFSPDDRPGSMCALRDRLQRELRPWRRTTRWVTSHRRLAWLAMAMTLLIVSVGVVAWARMPSYGERQYLRGKDFLASGNYERALECFSATLSETPKRADALYGRGRARLLLDDPRRAIEDFKAARRLESNWKYNACIGYCGNQLGSHMTAAKFYEWVKDTGIESAEVYNNLGFSYLQSRSLFTRPERDELAKQCLDRAIELDPTLVAGRYNRAMLELDMAMLNSNYDPTGGLANIRSLLKLAPSSAEAYFLAARICAYSSYFDPDVRNEGMGYLAQAVHLATQRERTYMRNSSSLEPFHQMAEFDRLFSTPAPSVESPRLSRFVDPLRDE